MDIQLLDNLYLGKHFEQVTDIRKSNSGWRILVLKRAWRHKSWQLKNKPWAQEQPNQTGPPVQAVQRGLWDSPAHGPVRV